MPDWNTRLAVSYTDDAGQTVLLKPIRSFTPTFALNAEPVHSLEETHIGVVYMPEALSFSITVDAIGDVAAKLTVLALEGRRFDLLMQEFDGGDWGFKSIVMSGCQITQAGPTAATLSGAPAATFSGFALGASAEPKTGSPAQVP
jgi:hypothetical protein